MRLRKVFLAAPLLLTLAACSSKEEEKGEEVTYDQWQETMDVNNSVNCIYNIDYMINNGMKLKIESTEKSSKIKTTMVTEIYGNTFHANISASIIKVDMLGFVEKVGDDFTITSLTDTIEEAKDNYRTFKYGNKFYYETDNISNWSETIKLDEFVAAKDTFYNFN